MPRVARFKIAAVENLFRQLRYAPAEKRIAQMNAAESLIADIDPRQNYPEDFVVYRVTGYRPRSEGESTMLVGEALLPDLINLVQRLSDSLELPPDFEGREPIPITETAEKLNISTKTVQRYRKQGLVCHYVVFPDDVKRLVCFEDALKRFVARHEQRLERAQRFTRVGEGIEADMVADARQLREKEGVSLNEAAARVAAKFGRAHETVRLILRRHDRRARQPIFSAPGPLTQRDIRVIFRAWNFGVPVAELARRFGKGPPAIHRALNRRRLELLRRLKLAWIELPTFQLDDAESVLLSGPVVNADLDDVLPDVEALELIERARARPAPSEATTDSLVAAYNFLKMRAAKATAEVGDMPSSLQLDVVESRLRWAARLKRRLVTLAFPAALRAVEQALHRPLQEHSAEEIVRLVQMGCEVVSRNVEGHDPTRKGQKLERVCGYAMGRAMAALYEDRSVGRARARHEAKAIPLDRPLSRLCPWQAWLELRPDLAAAVDSLSAEDRGVIEMRYGLGGGRPHDIERLAERKGVSVPRMTRWLQRIERELRERVRSRLRRP